MASSRLILKDLSRDWEVDTAVWDDFWSVEYLVESLCQALVSTEVLIIELRIPRRIYSTEVLHPIKLSN